LIAVGGLAMAWALAACAAAVWMAYRVYHPSAPARPETPRDLGLPFEVHSIPVAGRRPLALNAWFIPAGDAAHTVIVAHAWGAQKADRLKYAHFLHHCGFNVLLFDLRNPGRSGRDPSPRGMADRFTDDVDAVIRHWRDRLGKPGARLGLVAFSFSTWPALYHVATRPLSGVAALVLDSGPPMSIEGTAVRFIESYGARWLPWWLRQPGVFPLFKKVYVFALRWMLGGGTWPPPLKALEAAVLFIVGDDDHLMPVLEVSELAARARQAELWVVPGAQHLKTFKTRPDEYAARVRAFLDEHLGGARLVPGGVAVR
jgi:pimeloyl-ACP methyl ester carboxylesterase